MGNFSIYLNKKESDKVTNVAAECNVQKGRIMRIILHAFPEDYLKQLVSGYKDDLG